MDINGVIYFVFLVLGQNLMFLGILIMIFMNLSRCLKCNSSNCMFVDCVEYNIVICMQVYFYYGFWFYIYYCNKFM